MRLWALVMIAAVIMSLGYAIKSVVEGTAEDVANIRKMFQERFDQERNRDVVYPAIEESPDPLIPIDDFLYSDIEVQ